MLNFVVAFVTFLAGYLWCWWIQVRPLHEELEDLRERFRLLMLKWREAELQLFFGVRSTSTQEPDTTKRPGGGARQW